MSGPSSPNQPNSRKKYVGESSNQPGHKKTMPAYIKQTLEDMERQLEFGWDKCHVLASEAQKIDARNENRRTMFEKLTFEHLKRMRDIKEEYEHKVKELRDEYDSEDYQRKRLLDQLKKCQDTQQEKLTFIENMRNEYSDG